MPTNVTYGSCVEFTAVFFDGQQNVTVPTSGSLTIVYTQVSSLGGSTASVTIGLVQNGPSNFVGSWDSSVSAYGLVNYSVTAPGAVNVPAASGQLRIIN